MLFNSFEFLLIFLPITLTGFFLLGRSTPHAAAAWLAVASLVFYGWWNPIYTLLLLASITFNYLMGGLIARCSNQKMRRTWLILAIGADLALLAYYKYANFFVSNVSATLGLDWNLAQILLPLGISFFTFTQIAFLVDTYRGIAKEYNPVHYILFVTYFPHLVAGPILHHKEIMPQFADKSIYHPNSENFSVGLTIFAIGLFKKTVLADSVAPYASPMFAAAADGGSPTFFEAWGGALAYTLQLYFDFSGYSDMAIGLSRLFGVQLPINFHSPYRAGSIIEFWRRWHITLSRFLRDYLYISLGGNRHGTFRRYVNLLITMILGGLWHGAGWTFVIWGFLHGAYLVINHGWIAIRHHFNWTASPWPYRLSAQLLTLIAVIIGWVFFRATDAASALRIFQGMMGFNGVSLPAAFEAALGSFGPLLARAGMTFELGGGRHFVESWSLILPLFAIVLLAPNTQQIMARFRPGLDFDGEPAPRVLQWAPTRRWGIAIGIVAGMSVLSLTRVSEFLYFQF